jgi:hypothetical protein
VIVARAWRSPASRVTPALAAVAPTGCTELAVQPPPPAVPTEFRLVEPEVTK